MIKKVNIIANAWWNYSLSKLHIEGNIPQSLAKARAEVCEGCEFRKFGSVLTRFKDEIKEAEGYFCSDCGGCPLVAKIRGSEVCRKWSK